jgi:hypothetical protein
VQQVSRSSPNKGKVETGALGRHKGRNKEYKPSSQPRRPVKDRLKEPHPIKMSPERNAPKPVHIRRGLYKTAKSRRGHSGPLPSRGINEKLLSFIDEGKLFYKERPRVRNPKPKLIYQKWDLSNEPWNFLRSPSLRRLKSSLMKVKRGLCPFYEFKDLFKKVEIRTSGRYNRILALLEGGLLYSALPIGSRITPQIRKVRKPSFRNLEIIVSKLPFWATSYKFATLYKLALLLAPRQASCRACETH